MSETTHAEIDVDEPKITDAPDDVSIDRWTKYGNDRLYIEGARINPYIDLDDGTLNDTGRVRTNIEFNDDTTVTVTIGKEASHSPKQKIVISLAGDADTDECEDEESSFDNMTEDEFDSLEVGDEVIHVNDDQTQEVISVGEYNPLAGGRTEVRAQQRTITRNYLDKWSLVDQ